MDRDYRNPDDVARTSQVRVEEALVREVRRGIEARPFVMRQRFHYADGRTGPLLYIGAVSRAWADYLSANARATDLVVGVCSTGPGVGAGRSIKLEVRSGRGATDGNLREMNRVMRRLGIRLAYVPTGGSHANEGSAEGASETAQQTPSRLDLAADARVLRDRFEAFKASPSAEALAELKERVETWRAALASAPEMRHSKAALFVEKLATTLESKGAATAASDRA